MKTWYNTEQACDGHHGQESMKVPITMQLHNHMILSDLSISPCRDLVHNHCAKISG